MMKTMLIESANAMRISMTDRQAAQFEAYHIMLAEANQTMNLTRVPADQREAVDRHYLDSIAPLQIPMLLDDVKTLVDVGSGAGLPGIPLAIMLPGVRVTLIDSLAKRVKFLESVIERLSLNATALHARAEDAGRSPSLREQFDLACARAVAGMNVLAELTLPLVRVGGKVLALKGPSLDGELAGAGQAIRALGGEIGAQYPLPIPGRDWDHRAALLLKARPTPGAYPRKAGEPAKKPL